ncbi:Crp/Fnr family transcriptional regulator [Yinghuangia seranimata]|uniref:Crp/Fnr family transcriptional regulator n=1 Tax=Yinghuangia seranimata TaxID=408067 RepID=UPI00248C1FF7|nr:Crp/Fnr family transcriptional regulator [Yinghuangia seranimata]MDI2132007.1 Crp/Fnr family transcriptional regulator [Yinghuangia seranimata]
MGLFGGDRAFLDALTPFERGRLLSLGTPRAYTHDETVIRENDRTAFVVLLMEGWATVSVSTERGRLILALRGAGEMVGDIAAVDHGPRSATVTALGPLTSRIVPADRFRSFLAANPHANMLVMRQLAARLRSSDGERRTLASLTVLQRVAARLAELAEHTGVPDRAGTRVELPFPQHELAAAVGCTREAVAKALRLLREQGVVRTGPRHLEVADADLLRLLGTGREPQGRPGAV